MQIRALQMNSFGTNKNSTKKSNNVSFAAGDYYLIKGDVVRDCITKGGNALREAAINLREESVANIVTAVGKDDNLFRKLDGAIQLVKNRIEVCSARIKGYAGRANLTQEESRQLEVDQKFISELPKEKNPKFYENFENDQPHEPNHKLDVWLDSLNK